MGRRSSWSALAVCVQAVALTSCGGGDGVRGFGARQLLKLRDPTVRLVGQPSENLFVYTTGGDLAGVGTNYWSVDVGNGDVENLGPTPPVFGTGVTDPLACRVDASPGADRPTLTLTVTDTQSGVVTVIDSISSSVGCPTASTPDLFVLRLGQTGDQQLWAGRYDHLLRVPVDMIIHDIVGGDVQTVAVRAAPSAAPNAHGIFAIDVATSAVAPLVTPDLNDPAWAPGATPEGGLTSGSLAVGSSSPRTNRIGDHYIYPRVMSDGGITIFAGPFAGSPRELALFRPDGTFYEIAARFGKSVPGASGAGGLGSYPVSGLAFYKPRAAGGVALAWNDDVSQFAACEVPTTSTILTALARPGGSSWAFFAQDAPGSDPIPGPLLLVDPAAADGATPASGCALVATENVLSAGFSPDGTVLFWLAAPPAGNPELWIAAADGSGPRRIGVGIIDLVDRPHFTSNTKMDLNLAGDLVWLDIRDDPPQLHYVAEHVFGRGQAASPTWLVIGYALRSQDGIGTLGVVNRDTGTKRAISDAVADYRFLTRHLIADPVRVVFLRRGRTPSPEDGLWFATINPADLN